FKRGDYEQADGLFRQAMKLDPSVASDPDYALYLGLADFKMERYQDALKNFKTFSAGDGFGYFLAANAYAKLGKTSGVEQSLARVMKPPEEVEKQARSWLNPQDYGATLTLLYERDKRKD